MKLRLSLESIILALVCLGDMLSTLYLTSVGVAVEQNPLMAACIRHGTSSFILIKLLSFLPFIAVTEWYRRRNARFAQGAARTAIALYVLVYVIITAQTNLA